MRFIARSAWILAGSVLGVTASAHPGRGIVVNAQREVFVADAVRSVVWKIAPGGEVSALARGVHGHWLSLADDGSVLADHEYYDAASATFPRGLKRISPDGSIETLIPEKPDPDGLDAGAFAALPKGYVMVRESSARLVYRESADAADAGDDLKKETDRAAAPTNSVDLKDTGGTGPVSSLIDLPGGALIGVRGRSVVRIEHGAATVVATVPKEPGPSEMRVDSLWGVAAGENGEIFAGDAAARRVVRIDPSGTITTAASSRAPWFPTGVAVSGGTLYVLEHGLENGKNLGPKVVCIEKGKEPRVLATVTE